jgi:hypothetical protein
MSMMRKLLVAVALSPMLVVAAHAQVKDEIRTDDVVICATAADAKDYAATHKDTIQRSIESERDGRACLVANVAFMAGRQSERFQHKDATYVVTEILIVGVKTRYGLLSMRPNLAYTLLKVEEEKV